MKVTHFGVDGFPWAHVTDFGGVNQIIALGSNTNTDPPLSALNYVQRITANGSNILLNPIVNFAAGSNILLTLDQGPLPAQAMPSNTIRIHSTGGGSGNIITSNGSNSLAAVVNLKAGVGIALGVSGQDITITNTNSGGGGGSGNYTGVPWSSGTSMPGSPSTNQRITRTDLGLDFYYDGTRWLSTTLYRESIGSHQVFPGSPVSGDIIGRWTMWASQFEIYLDAFYASTFVLTTNDGTKFWTVDFENSATTSIASFNTSADTVNTWTRHRVAIGSVRTAATDLEYEVKATKTSTPGGLYWAMSISYRLIGT